MFYDLTQLKRNGFVAHYSDDPWNYLDTFLILTSVFNIVFQLAIGPRSVISKILMCFIVFALIMKTFFFLRIFQTLTPIVVMLTNVVYDLRIFMLFYTILIFMFS